MPATTDSATAPSEMIRLLRKNKAKSGQLGGYCRAARRELELRQLDPI